MRQSKQAEYKADQTGRICGRDSPNWQNMWQDSSNMQNMCCEQTDNVVRVSKPADYVVRAY